jgi:hypothetical protein
MIGVGMGVLFWNTVLLIIGWAIARFGLFGVTPEIPSNQMLNYIGVAFAALSGVFYLFVKTETNSSGDEIVEPLIHHQTNSGLDSQTPPVTSASVNDVAASNDETKNANDDNSSMFDKLHPKVKRLLGTGMACVSGVLYAFTFTPALYVQDTYANASQDALDYVFSLYTGIFLSSVFYFTVYCAYRRNKPKVYPQVILPALISGI